jgi:two-component system CheB/CheR fusion protein
VNLDVIRLRHERFVLTTAIDITARKEAEEALRAALEKLQRADRERSLFLTSLSHELRNPLAPLRHSLHILDRAEPGSEQAERAKAIAHRQVSHLSRLVDDLLDAHRLAQHKMELRTEATDLLELVRRCLDDHRASFETKGVALHGPPQGTPLWVSGDPMRLQQALGNLLHNALKFTPAGGETQVSVTGSQADVLVCVEDTGRGLSAALARSLFVPFVQGDPSFDQSLGGLGLGLAIVKGILELHRGSIDAAPGSQGRGAKFTLRLPRLALKQAQARRVPSETKSLRPRRVLLIEDNVDAAETLSELLALAGHVVKVAHEGTAGIHLAESFQPDIVFCDIGLPGLTGYEIASRLQRLEGLKARLVALSGYSQTDDLLRMRKAGFHAHLAKPASLEALEEQLQCAGERAVLPLQGMV